MNDEQFDQRDQEHHKEMQRLKNKQYFANRRLQENLKIAIDALKNLIDKTEYGVNQWQKAWSPDKETDRPKSVKSFP